MKYRFAHGVNYPNLSQQMIRYTKREEIWNAASHGGGILLGVVFGIIFLGVVLPCDDNNWAGVGVILYLFGMLGSYVASTLYHSMAGIVPSGRSVSRNGITRPSTGILRAPIRR